MRGQFGSGLFALVYNVVTSAFIARFGKIGQRPFYAAIFEGNKIVAVFYMEFSHKSFRIGNKAVLILPQGFRPLRAGDGSAQSLDLYRTPDFFDGKETTFFFVMRPHDAVGGVVTHVVYAAVMVGAHQALDGKHPEKGSGAAGMSAHHYPVIPKSGAVAAVVEAVQDFGGHKDFGFAHVFLRFAVGTVMHGFEAAEITLGVKYRAFLRIPGMKFTVEFRVPAPLIAVGPPDDARMVQVAGNHLFYQLFPHFGVVLAVPAAEFVHYVKSQLIAGIQKSRIGGIMRQTDGVQVHFAHKTHIVVIVFSA